MALPDLQTFLWPEVAGAPRPPKLAPVDDRLNAKAALARLQRGEALLYTGDWRNARQLLSALKRRLKPKPKSGRKVRSARDAFNAERLQRGREHALLSRLVIPLTPSLEIPLPHAPALQEPLRELLGPTADAVVLPLTFLLGVQGADGWTRSGVEVPGLKGRIHPRYGVYLPTRTDYVELLLEVAPLAAGRTVLDLGTGTGVLSFLLLQHGAERAVGIDVDPRAVRCAEENAERLGLSDRFVALEGSLYEAPLAAHLPEGRADLVVCNPPWLPMAPKTRLDRAVYDAGGAMLRGFLTDLRAHLRPDGRGLLLLSDLAIRLGLREPGWLEAQFEEAGLLVDAEHARAPSHPKAHDPADPLHAARAGETTRLYVLRAG